MVHYTSSIYRMSHYTPSILGYPPFMEISTWNHVWLETYWRRWNPVRCLVIDLHPHWCWLITARSLHWRCLHMSRAARFSALAAKQSLDAKCTQGHTRTKKLKPTGESHFAKSRLPWICLNMGYPQRKRNISSIPPGLSAYSLLKLP